MDVRRAEVDSKGSLRGAAGLVGIVLVLFWSSVVMAAPGEPIAIGEATLDPVVDARVRLELVDQGGQPATAEALAVRARIGGELKLQGFSLLAEGEATVALVSRYNDTLPVNGVEPFPVIPDPENLELNRLQIAYVHQGSGITIGRQRIIHDNARFVGNSGWRQNEQTFDAVRGQAKLGPVVLDAAYSVSQRTVFGINSANEHFDGEYLLLNGGIDLPAVDVKGFAYLLDYDTRAAFSSKTYGVLATGSLNVPALGKLEALASYARQSNHGANPVDYGADYVHARLGASVLGFALAAGYEQLGSDGGAAAFQTPLATLHAFNGWADLFLTTPAAGLRDHYISLGRALEIGFMPGFRADVTYHEFDSDFGSRDYGTEWDASLGFKLGPVGLLAKYAAYDADTFSTDTEKFWLQAEISF